MALGGDDSASSDDPYSHYAGLREAEPIAQLGPGYWVVTSYEESAAVLREPRTSSRRPQLDLELIHEEVREDVAAVRRHFDKWLPMIDPPDHTRLRKLVGGAFTPRVVEGLRGRIDEIAAELLDEVQDRPGMDVIGDLAYPLPVRVIAELLGLPPGDAEQFKGWSDALAAVLGGDLATPDGVARAAHAAESLEALDEYLGALIQERRAHRRDDLLSELVAAEADGAALSREELVSTCVLLLVAGHETTTNLIGNGTLALLRNPDELRRLRDDPTLMPRAIEELLRYDSPVQGAGRALLVDLELGGHALCAGDWVDVWIGAANRDPAVFPEPDRLDLGRVGPRHLAFSHGAHYCLGAALARLEAEIAFTRLLRLPLELTDEPLRWSANPVLRGLEALPVRFADVPAV